MNAPPRPDEPERTRDAFGVAGKVVLITGGGRGIGRAVAEGFVRAGARVYIASRSEEQCAATAADLSRHGECVALAPADVATVAGCRALAQWVGELEGRVDVLVNNAGALAAQPLLDFEERAWDEVFDLNVKGVFFMVQSFLPLLLAAGSLADPARVVNIGSIDGMHVPLHESYAYSASKAAAHQLSKHLASQLAGLGITVNVIAPGAFKSDMLQFALETKGEDAIVAPVPLRRLTSGEDMASAALYLSSRAGSYLTGVVLPVDGGRVTTL